MRIITKTCDSDAFERTSGLGSICCLFNKQSGVRASEYFSRHSISSERHLHSAPALIITCSDYLGQEAVHHPSMTS